MTDDSAGSSTSMSSPMYVPGIKEPSRPLSACAAFVKSQALWQAGLRLSDLVKCADQRCRQDWRYYDGN